MLITNATQLAAFVKRARTSDVLAIDTEFLREKTYWPRLCLLQLGTEDEAVAIDPFAVKDLTPITELLLDEGIVKLFHAASQDLEILYHELGVLPKPVFDTQAAAALLGHTLHIGYAALVQGECDVRLKKADSYTDWSRRPLTQSQIEYALDDVVYLPRIYRSMMAKLGEKGRSDWLDKDFEDLIDPKRYVADPRSRYLKLRRVNQLSRCQLSAAREVAAWRESTAMRRNIPRKWIISDEQIVEACKREPASLDELFMVRGIRDSLSMSDARAALDAILCGLCAPEEEWPVQYVPARHENNVDAQVDLMTSLVRLRARENDIAFAVLTSHDELVRIARGYTDDCELLTGWRKAMVGDELMELLDGRLSLSFEDGMVKVTKNPRD